MRKKALWFLGLLALLLILAGCAPDATQSPLQPAGSTAEAQKNLFVPVFWTAVAVFVIVEGGIVMIAVKYRRKKGRDRMPPQIHGNTRLEIGWTILPALVLAVVMVPTVGLVWDLARAPAPDALHVTVKGYQWWWGFEYTDQDMATSYDKALEVADVLVVPAGREIYLSLEANGGLIVNDDPYKADYQVIHSFWAPRLFGKQDVVPGRTNHILFSADEPGIYTGQCAEFCGLQHGRMKFRIQVLSAADWDAWVANQKLGGADPTDPLATKGMELFMNPLSDGRGACIACHAIGGTDAGGIAAPNLTHFGADTHSCFAGCNWDVSDVDALNAWLQDPNAVKLGAKMPNYQLSSDEIDALVAYLTSLK
ncbi:MAG: cytochrome c oxidase subunit II [Actinomycetota bacterium]